MKQYGSRVFAGNETHARNMRPRVHTRVWTRAFVDKSGPFFPHWKTP